MRLGPQCVVGDRADAVDTMLVAARSDFRPGECVSLARDDHELVRKSQLESFCFHPGHARFLDERLWRDSMFARGSHRRVEREIDERDRSVRCQRFFDAELRTIMKTMS
jgi:hypothetical protein